MFAMDDDEAEEEEQCDIPSLTATRNLPQFLRYTQVSLSGSYPLFGHEPPSLLNHRWSFVRPQGLPADKSAMSSMVFVEGQLLPLAGPGPRFWGMVVICAAHVPPHGVSGT
jgi:hypothetical protein